MKPQLLKVPHKTDDSFSIRKDMVPYINNRWHYHEEVELIYFHKGSGTQFVGDNIRHFKAGDIVLVGSNLPHYWKYDDIHFLEKEDEIPFSSAIHFHENFLGDQFLDIPECKVIKGLLEKAKRGLLINGPATKDISILIERVFQVEGLNRIIALLKCLIAFSEVSDSIKLSSMGFHYNLSAAEHDRINCIYNYTLRHFNQKIYLKEIADLANLAPNSFCRYFKLKTGKTYSCFLTEIRVGYACKLLLDNKQSVKQISFESGFDNFSCFHKSFKKITGKTPQSYKKEYSVS